MRFDGALDVPGVQEATIKFIKGLKTIENPGSTENRQMDVLQLSSFCHSFLHIRDLGFR